MIKISLKILLLLNIIFAVAVKAEAPSAPPNECEMHQSVWCIYLGPSEIVNQPSETVEYRSIWTVRGSLHPLSPLIVLEPRGCRVGLSDVIELVSFNTNFKWEQSYWNRTVARLKSDKSCDLELLTPISETNEITEAFSNSLNLIKACRTEHCDGYLLGEKILNLADRLGVNQKNDILLNKSKAANNRN